MNKILILGSEGFIGTHLIAYYRKVAWDVTGYDICLTETSVCNYNFIPYSDNLNRLFSEANFDVCINAAGCGSIPYSIDNPILDFAANAYDTIKFLDGIRIFNPRCKYFHISSAAVYGTSPNLPINENEKLNPLSPYGWHKLISELICKEYYNLYGLNITIVRPFSVYGPGLKKQLFWDLFQKSILPGDTIELWGSGKETRDFIYIDDLIRAIAILVQHNSKTIFICNIASGIEISIGNVAEKFIKILCGHKRIVYNNRIKEGDPINWRGDNSLLEGLNFKAQFNIDQGLQNVASWLKSLPLSPDFKINKYHQFIYQTKSTL
jgi:UDP-glucose 4-epimerase